MPASPGAKNDARQRREWQRLDIGGSGLIVDPDTGELAINLATDPGLQIINDGLSVKIDETNSLYPFLQLSSDGLGTVDMLQVTGLSATQRSITLRSDATGNTRVGLEHQGTGSSLIYVQESSILTRTGLLSTLLTTPDGFTVDIDKGNFVVQTSAGTDVIDYNGAGNSALALRTDGGSSANITLLPGTTLNAQGADVTLAGGGATNANPGDVNIRGGQRFGAGNGPGGVVYILGGVPRGTGNSQVLIQVRNASGTASTVLSARRDGSSGNDEISFFSTSSHAAQQTPDKGLKGLIDSLDNYGLINSGSDIKGGPIFNVRNSPSSPVTAATHDLINADTSSAAVTVNLPAIVGSGWEGNGGEMIIVKDAAANAGTNNITINPNGSDTIDGAASLVISTNGGVARLVSDGAGDWTVI